MAHTAVDVRTIIAAQERTVTPSTGNAVSTVYPIVVVNTITAPHVGVNAVSESPGIVMNTVSVP